MKRIFLIGYMGSGKTAMGRMLAAHLGLEFIDLDAYIENKYRLTIARIFEQEGETGFREIERKCLHEVAEFENVVIGTGGGAACFFDNMELMNRSGDTIYLKLSAEHLAARLATTKAGIRPILQHKSGDELLQFIKDNLKHREPYYLQAKYIIEGNDQEIERRLIQLEF
jgi:shikimate kinase